MTKVFLNYDQVELDAELNLRQRWPEHVEFFERWAAQSAAVYEKLPSLKDLAYGVAPSQKLDLFMPETENDGVPVLLFIHGGYWQALDKSDFAFVAPAFLAKGIAFATMNYTLAPEGRIEEMVLEAQKAFAWLGDKAGDLGLDRDAIVVCGHSAGGHLATMTALCPSGLDKTASGTESRAPLAAASISGLYDLEPIRLSYHNAVLGLDRKAAYEQSPMNHLSAGSSFLLGVGGAETTEFLRQQSDFAKSAREAGNEVEALELAGLNHFSIMDALADPQEKLYKAVTDLFGQ